MNETREYRLTVRGMTCEHCAKTVGNAVRSVAGVMEADVNYQTGKAIVVGESSLDPKRLVTAIQNAGYAATVEGVIIASDGAPAIWVGPPRAKAATAAMLTPTLSSSAEERRGLPPPSGGKK